MIETPQVVVVTSNRSVRRHATRALASAGCRVHHCPVERSKIDEQLAQQREMYLVDIDEDPQQVEWLLGQLFQHSPDTIPLILSHDLKNQFLIDLLAHKGLNNLVARHGGLSATHELIDEHELIVTCYKLFQRDIFGLQKYISTVGVKIHEFEVQSSAAKGDALGELGQFLDDIDCYGAITPAITLVAEELLMNAIYNAPRDASGRPKYAAQDRREPVSLEPNEYVTFRYACDGRYVALSITDNFGSLGRDIIVRYLEHTFRGKKAEVEDKRGGAGIGLYMVLNSITQLTFNIHAGRKTEVVALFYIRSGARAFKTSGRSLNIFLLND